MASEYTTYYNLDKYTATDKPNLRDQYNAAMDKIDDDLHSINADAADAKLAAVEAKNAADALSAIIPATSYTSSATVADAIATANDAIGAIEDIIPKSQYSSSSTVKDAIDAVKALLPASAFSNTNTVKAAIDNIVVDTDHDILLFGDSWTDTSTSFPKWMTEAFKDLHYGTVYNYAVTGSGYVTGTTIATQISSANSALTTAQKAKITDVVIFALVNDLKGVTSYDTFNSTRTSILTAMQNAFVDIKNNYPRARVFMIPTVCGPTYTNADGFKWLCMFNKSMASGSANSWNIPYVSDFINVYLQWNDTAIYGQTGTASLHLNESGSKVIGAAINKVLKGIPIPAEFENTETWTHTNGTLDIQVFYHATLKIVCKFTAASNLASGANTSFGPTAGTAIAKLLFYQYCRRSATGYGNGIVGIMATGGGVIYGLLSVTNAGNVSVNLTSAMNANVGIYGTI